MPVTGQKLVARNIFKAQNGFFNTVNKTMDQVRDILDKKITENISLRDHSLRDLRALGHPYAARYGETGRPIHDPYWQVHVQSGKLLSSKRSGTVKASLTAGKLEAVAFAGLSENTAPHALFVVFGTSKMIPRPVLGGSREQVLQQSYDLIKSNIKNIKFNFEQSK